MNASHEAKPAGNEQRAVGSKQLNAKRKGSKAINRRFTQMDTKGTALSAWRKATK